MSAHLNPSSTSGRPLVIVKLVSRPSDPLLEPFLLGGSSPSLIDSRLERVLPLPLNHRRLGNGVEFDAGGSSSEVDGDVADNVVLVGRRSDDSVSRCLRREGREVRRRRDGEKEGSESAFRKTRKTREGEKVSLTLRTPPLRTRNKKEEMDERRETGRGETKESNTYSPTRRQRSQLLHRVRA